MKYCSRCGQKLSQTVPPGDNRLRFVCNQCDTIHYQNPRIITGCLPIHEDQILLCKRAIEPRADYWTLPAGFLENAETAADGALREMQEEANASGSDPRLYTMFSLPHISQIYLFFMTELKDLNFSAGAESKEVRLFSQEAIPWSELAFPVIKQTIEFYFEDRPSGEYPVRVRDILYQPHKRG